MIQLRSMEISDMVQLWLTLSTTAESAKEEFEVDDVESMSV